MTFTVPEKDGLALEGWYNGETKVNLNTFIMPAENVTLTAKWIPKIYYLQFDANGGMPCNDYQALKARESAVAPITPIKTGFMFDGWYNGTQKVDFSDFKMPATNVSVTAKWAKGEDETRGFGNVNGDTKIDAADALNILKMAVKKLTFNIDQTCYGDVNADGKLDAADALLVLKYAVKKLSEFPCVAYYANKTPEVPSDDPDEPGPDIPNPPKEPDPTPADLNVDIMTFNIRQSGANNDLDGDNGWLNRRDYVMEYLNNSGADIMCLQEVRKSQGADITEKLTSPYKCRYFGRESIANPEGLMTIYNSEKYQLMTEQLFWLSTTPDVASLGWGARYYRICAVLTLQDKATGNLLNVFNLHLDHEVEEARVNGLKLIMERMASMKGHNIVAGDFNTTERSGCYNIIADKMTDTKAAPGAVVYSTNQEFGAGKGEEHGMPIDFIFVDQTDTVIKSYKICNDTFKDSSNLERNYSDHYAVRSTVTFTYK